MKIFFASLTLMLFHAASLQAQSQWTPRKDWLGQDRSQLSHELLSRTILLKNFAIEWSKDRGQISVLDHDQKVLWESAPGRVFVMAAQGEESVLQWRGSFTIRDRPGEARCREQTVDSFTETEKGVTVLGRLLGPECDLVYSVQFEEKGSKRLGLEVILAKPDRVSRPEKINRTYLAYASQPDEGFYGFGEQFTHLNMKGRIVPILVSEQGHLRGRQPYSFVLNQISEGAAGAWYTSYASIPFYMTSKLRSLFLESSAYSSFDFSNPEQVEVVVWQAGLQAQILSGDSPLEILSGFTEYAGRMPLLPSWIHKGAIVGVMGGSAFVRDIWEKLKKAGTPIGGFWIQDWMGKRETKLGIRMWWNWQRDSSVYPDWEELVADFKAAGIETLGYINPFLSDARTNSQHARNLFQEAKDQGFLVLKRDGSPYEIDSGGFTGTLIDFTNPKAYVWYKEIIKSELIGNGMKGWMADFGEALPFDAVLHAGHAPLIHNRYPELWAQVNREAIQEAGLEGDALAFLRSAYTRSPASAQLFWLGDQMTTWDEHDGMKSAVHGLLSGGLSGLSLNHADMGGLIALYKSLGRIPIINFRRTRELMLRGIEMGAFTAIFRNHEGNDPSANFQFYSDEETLAFYVRFAKIFALLAPYREGLFQEATEKGYPVARHLLLHYPNDPIAWTIKDQWLLGPDFLFAPVLEPGARERRLYLPEGRWTHAWSGGEWELEQGEWITVSAPLGVPALFYKSRSQAGAEFREAMLKI